jgi:hypothetical protein
MEKKGIPDLKNVAFASVAWLASIIFASIIVLEFTLFGPVMSRVLRLDDIVHVSLYLSVTPLEISTLFKKN